ncbi:BsuPI-related putative proteinase inhibitor [Natronospira bacteriovora]|uniref:Intracellular proteinase inhibitor BsuPI domain-containing protein n=1 Tax=Natronospira bacteriovora TaxID=3069753 RepID=A0ABU0W8A0_9GAMM|nr:BsuPI-related putative proteinase inhibitor [Natronospira sp. AB-CW4]MDQ2069685.1 BsuPI-related putative proteinase inhibitor [Natronospira sp. AB-CW4]
MFSRTGWVLVLVCALIALTACNSDDAVDAPDFVTELRLETADGTPTDRFDEGDDAVVVLLVRNRSWTDQTLTFNNARTNDFVVLDASGNAVRVWSTTRLFAAAMTEVTIAANSTRRFEMDWPGLDDDNRSPLPEGEYEIQGWLPTLGEDGIDDLSPGPLRSTLVPFTIGDDR